MALAVVLPAVTLPAVAAHAQTATLGASDFSVVLSQIDSSNTGHAAAPDELTSLLPAVRCSCPINLAVAVSINSTSLANVGANDTFTATVMVGQSCDNTASTSCARSAPLSR